MSCLFLACPALKVPFFSNGIGWEFAVKPIFHTFQKGYEQKVGKVTEKMFSFSEQKSSET